ncbi:MAG: lytic murein transglycosylase [Blastococcus sp.]
MVAGLAVAVLLVWPQEYGTPAAAGSTAAGSTAAGSSAAGAASAPAPVVESLRAATSPSDWSPPAPTTVGTPSSVRAQPVVALRTVSALTSDGIPAVAFTAYTRAAAAVPAACHLRWSLLAAIGRVESDHGRFGGAALLTDGLSAPPVIGLPLNGAGTALVADTDHGRLDGDPFYDHAVGPMQFIPSTWARYASDGNGDGRADPFNVYDAALAAARYLCAAGGDLGGELGQARAVLAYNHSASYVATVLTLAATYAGSPPPRLAGLPSTPPTAPPANPAPPPAIGVAAAAHLPTGSATTARSSTTGSTTTATSTTAALSAATATGTGTTTASSTTAGSTTASSTTAASSTASSTTATSTTATSTTAASGTASSSTAGSTTATSTTAASSTASSTTATSTTATSTTATSTTATSTTAAPTTAAPTTTAPTTTAPTTTAPTTAAPTTATSSTSSSTTAASTTSSTATLATTSCQAPPSRATVDVVNETGRAAVGTDVAAHLTAAGVLVGTVTSVAGSTATAIEYPAAQLEQARSLAAALHAPAYLHAAGVAHITVVLRADDMGPLVTAVDALPAATCGH